MFVNLYT